MDGLGSKGWKVVCIKKPLTGVRQALQGKKDQLFCHKQTDLILCVDLPTCGSPRRVSGLPTQTAGSIILSSWQQEQCSWHPRTLGWEHRNFAAHPLPYPSISLFPWTRLGAANLQGRPAHRQYILIKVWIKMWLQYITTAVWGIFYLWKEF